MSRVDNAKPDSNCVSPGSVKDQVEDWIRWQTNEGREHKQQQKGDHMADGTVQNESERWVIAARQEEVKGELSLNSAVW